MGIPLKPLNPLEWVSHGVLSHLVEIGGRTLLTDPTNRAIRDRTPGEPASRKASREGGFLFAAFALGSHLLAADVCMWEISACNLPSRESDSFSDCNMPSASIVNVLGASSFRPQDVCQAPAMGLSTLE